MSRKKKNEFPLWHLVLLTLLPAIALVTLCVGAACGNTISVLSFGCVSTLVGTVIRLVLIPLD